MPRPGSEPADGIKHPAVRAARVLSSPVEREAQDRYLLEGVDLISQALAQEVRLFDLFVADRPVDAVPPALIELAAARAIPIYRVTPGVLFKIMGTSYDTAITAVAVAARKQISEEQLTVGGTNWLAVGESIQDPRNIGVLIRTADAAGCSALALSQDSEDPYSRAAVRSSTGSILRLPIHRCADLPALLGRLARQGVRIVGTSAHAERLIWETDLRVPTALVFGNESHGLSAAAKAQADVLARIPLLGGAHSLNVAVAAGIALFEGVRQRSVWAAGCETDSLIANAGAPAHANG